MLMTLVPENIDVDLADEFRHVIQWADDNKMIINQSKTTEIVFRRPSLSWPKMEDTDILLNDVFIYICRW